MKKKLYIPYLFLLPALSTLLIFFFLPIIAAFFLSVTDFDIYALGTLRAARIVGLNNYINILTDSLFWKSVLNTVYFVMIGVPLTISVSFLTALALNSRLLRFKKFFRLAFFMPVITTLVAVAVVWRYIYHPTFGIVNYFLSFFHIPPIDWLGDPHWAMPALIVLAVWKNFGYNMMIFLAGLHAIPGSLYEAARIDGANWWQQQLYITIPQLAPTTLFISIFTVIGYAQFFAEPYVMTQGGPLNSTLSIVLYLYQQGFRWWQMGYASAIAFVLFFFLVLLGILSFVFRKAERGIS